MAIETIDVNSSGSTGTTKTTRTPSAELGKDDFLKLLTVQLQNQDPMNPMENTEYISQMSSFSSLEQMLNMNKNIEKLVSTFSASTHTQAMMYLGTTVTAKTSDMEEPVTGIVEQVGFESGVPYLKVGKNAFSLDDVQLVSPTYS